MTKIKMCGLSRNCDIEYANEIKPNYIGFVFAKKSKRYVSPEKAGELKALLSPEIQAVGVFVDEPEENVLELLKNGTIDIAQLHGNEKTDYIRHIKEKSGKPVIKAVKLDEAMSAKGLLDALLEDSRNGNEPGPDFYLIDSGAGSGKTFDWDLLKDFDLPYFLAGGLSPDNAAEAVNRLHPYCLDVSSGIETDGVKDKDKMAAFAQAVRKEEDL